MITSFQVPVLMDPDLRSSCDFTGESIIPRKILPDTIDYGHKSARSNYGSVFLGKLFQKLCEFVPLPAHPHALPPGIASQRWKRIPSRIHFYSISE